MRRKPILILAIVLITLAGLSPSNAGEALRVGGTGAATELLRALGAAYYARGGDSVEVIPSLGSTGALRALADGVLDLAVSARPLDPQEAAALVVLKKMRTPFVLATSHHRPGGIKRDDLAEL